MRTLPDLRESAQLWVQPTLLAYRRVAAPTHGRKWHTPTALICVFFVSYRSEAVIGERRARARLGPSLVESTTGAVAEGNGEWRLSGRTGASIHARAPFPVAAHRTRRADLPHRALGQDLTPSP